MSEIKLAGGEAGNSVEVAKLVRNAKVETGKGAGTFKAGRAESLTLTMGGAGSDKAQNVQINGPAVSFNYTGSSGDDALRIMGGVSNSNIDLGDGANEFTAQNTKGALQTVINTNFTASGDGATSLTMGKYTYSATGNNITLGAGANAVNLGAVSGKGAAGLKVDLSASELTQKVTLNGSANYLNYTGSRGEDVLNILGSLSNSNIDLGEGENSLTVKNAKGAALTVANTNITALGQSSNTITAGAFKAGVNGNSIILGEGANAINLSSISGGANGVEIIMAAAADEQKLNVSGSAVNVKYTGSAGADEVSFGGSVSKSQFELGDGDNSFTALGAKSNVTDSRIEAVGTGANTINILNFNSSAKGEAVISLGEGDDSVSLGTLRGNSSVDLGAGENTFKATSVDKAVVSGQGSGLYSVKTAKNMRFDLSGSTGDIRLDILTSLVNSTVDLGAGDARIGSGEEAANTVISGSAINSGTGKLTMDIKTLSASSVFMDASDADDPALLDLTVSGVMSKSQVHLGYGANKITAGSISYSAVSRLEKGELLLTSGNVTGGDFDLSGEGSDTIKINGNLNAKVYLGSGADNITVSGAMSGELKAEDNLTIDAASLYKLNGGLAGAVNRLNISKSVEKSALILGAGDNLVSSGDEENNNLNIISSSIKAGGKLKVDVKDVISSQISNVAVGEEETGLDLQVNKLNNSTVTLAAGDSTIKASAVQNSNITREAAGTLNLESASVSGTVIALTGEGADNITVSGNMSADITLGDTADKIAVGGALSGLLTVKDNIELNAKRLDNYSATLSGADNQLNVTEAVTGSSLDLGTGKAVVGAAGVNYSNTDITGGDADYSILGAKYEGGSITLGNGNNNLGLTESLSAKVTLGEGTNTVGAATTSLRGLNFSGAGTNTILGKDLVGGSVTMGAEGKVNKLLASGLIEGSSITLNGGQNTVGGAETILKASGIHGSGAGETVIEAKSMTGGSINLGESNDRVDIFGNIENASINLGEGVNTLRNTLGAGQDGSHVGQGSATGNTVSKSNITLSGNTNVYLGYIKTGAKLFGSGKNNINAATVEDSSLDASGMTDSYIGIGTLKGTGLTATGESTGSIFAGTGGRVEVNKLVGGGIYDNKGANTITVGDFGETSSITVGESIYSTTVHMNELKGALSLGNHNYSTTSADKITVADMPYPGTVKIEGVRVDGAGVAAPAVDSSGFGLGQGEPVG